MRTLRLLLTVALGATSQAPGQQCLLAVGTDVRRGAPASEDPAADPANPAPPAAAEPGAVAAEPAEAESAQEIEEVQEIRENIARNMGRANDQLGDALDAIEDTLKKQAKKKGKDIKQGRHFFYMEDANCKNGTGQSPINIQMTQVVLGQFSEESELLPRLNLTKVTGVKVSNKAHYIEVTPVKNESRRAMNASASLLAREEPSEEERSSGDASEEEKKEKKEPRDTFGTLRLPNSTGAGEVLYDAKWLRFSMPSHHAFNFMLTSGEMHIVFQKRGSKDYDDLAVVAVMLQDEVRITDDQLQAHADAVALQKTFLDALGFKIGGFPARDDSMSLKALEVDLMAVFANCFTGSYFHYVGSLVTPPCAKGVHWYVLQRPAAVSDAMVTAHYATFGGSPTNRPTQALQGREVAQNRISIPGEFGVASFPGAAL